jgi:molybdate transport system substrate-binding protein
MSSLRIMSAIAFRSAFENEIFPAFERQTQTTTITKWDPTKLLMDAIGRGERADVTVMTDEAVGELVEQGILVGASRVGLADAVLGLAVRKGTIAPDISTNENFRNALLAARSVAFSRAGASGIYFNQLIERLGIADTIRKKATIVPAGFTADRLVSGEADLAVQQLSELMAVNVDIVGPFPDEYQQATGFTAAVFQDCANPAGARRLLDMLDKPEAVRAYKAAGLVPRTASFPQL